MLRKDLASDMPTAPTPPQTLARAIIPTAKSQLQHHLTSLLIQQFQQRGATVPASTNITCGGSDEGPRESITHIQKASMMLMEIQLTKSIYTMLAISPRRKYAKDPISAKDVSQPIVHQALTVSKPSQLSNAFLISGP